MSDLLRHPVEIIRRLRGLPFGDSVTDRLDLAEGAPIAVVAWLANGSRLRQGRLVLGSSPIDCLAWQRYRPLRGYGETRKFASVTWAGDSVPSGHMAWKLKPEMRMVQLGTSSGDLCLAVPVSDVALVKDAVDGTEPSA
jgi:hypothetical protein